MQKQNVIEKSKLSISRTIKQNARFVIKLSNIQQILELICMMFINGK